MESSASATISRLAKRFAGQDIIILGNGPTGTNWQPAPEEMRPVWTINNGFQRVPDAASVTFVMDDLEGPAWRAHRNPEGWFGWLRETDLPVVTTRHLPEYPSTIEYPLLEVMRWAKAAYFAETASYMFAWAAFIGVRSLEVIGCDYWTMDRRQQRACAEFWLGRCIERGIPVQVHPYSHLLTVPPVDGVNRHHNGFYGYTALPEQLQHAVAQEIGAVPRHSDQDARTAAEEAGF